MAGRNTYRKDYREYGNYNNYVDGNTVKKEKIYEIPQREERTYDGNRRVRTSKEVHRNRENALHMSAAYVVLLAVCSIVIGVVCARYLSLRDEVSNKATQIAEIEMKTEALKAQNDSIDYAISSYTDIGYISKVATEELGMIQAGKDQISFYNSSESEYMKQYKNIPAK